MTKRPIAERKITMTIKRPRHIAITDVGTLTTLLLGPKGKIKVLESGGCAAEQILKGVRNYADSEKLARAILDRWSNGYDGDPAENNLAVTVSDWDGAVLNSLAHVRA